MLGEKRGATNLRESYYRVSISEFDNMAVEGELTPFFKKEEENNIPILLVW